MTTSGTQTPTPAQPSLSPTVPQNHNGTVTPHPMISESTASNAAKRMTAALFAPQQLDSVTSPESAVQFTQSDQIPGMKDRIQEKIKARLNPTAPQSALPAEPIVVPDPVVSVTTPETPEVEAPVEVAPVAEEGKDTTAENIRNMRNALKQTKTTAAELLQVKTELETKVKGYETGEVLTEESKKLKARIAELEPLEHLVNLKKSDGYALKLETVAAKTDALKALGKDYELPDDVMEEASKITNKRELNTFLDQHFDGVGALQAAQMISEIQGTRKELQSAEEAPKQALEKLNQDHLRFKEAEEIKRRDQVVNTSKSSWASALLGLRSEGDFQEIIPRDGDIEFNTTWVEPITKKAAEEYGKLVTDLGFNGLKKLDPEVGKGLATATILATIARTATARANAAEAKLRELETNTKREAPMLRPGMRGSGNAIPTAPQQQARGPEGAAKQMLKDILGR